MAQGPFIPSSIPSIISEETPRIVDVIGATVAVGKLPSELSRVRITTGRSLSGGEKRHKKDIASA